MSNQRYFEEFKIHPVEQVTESTFLPRKWLDDWMCPCTLQNPL